MEGEAVALVVPVADKSTSAADIAIIDVEFDLRIAYTNVMRNWSHLSCHAQRHFNGEGQKIVRDYAEDHPHVFFSWAKPSAP